MRERLSNRPCLVRLRRLAQTIAGLEREERFTRGEQLAMVMTAHLLILVGVTVIMWKVFDHHLYHWPPLSFVFWEISILVICFVVGSASPRPFVGYARKLGFRTMTLERWMDEQGDYVRARCTGAALLVAYVIQFVALVPLLEATGGPIDSPFAQLPVAIAIFTPFIANKPWTMGFVVGTAVIYYAVFVGSFGFEDPEAIRPTPASFVLVNVLILILASGLTLVYQNRREGRAAHSAAAHITVTQKIRAPRQEVWRAWTNAALLESWFRANGTELRDVLTDVRTGGRWQAVMQVNGDSTRWHGEYRTVVEPEMLKFTVLSEGDSEAREASVRLEDLEGETLLVFEESDRRNRIYERGWSAVLEQMCRKIEEERRKR